MIDLLLHRSSEEFPVGPVIGGALGGLLLIIITVLVLIVVLYQCNNVKVIT